MTGDIQHELPRSDTAITAVVAPLFKVNSEIARRPPPLEDEEGRGGNKLNGAHNRVCALACARVNMNVNVDVNVHVPRLQDRPPRGKKQGQLIKRGWRLLTAS
jgi:hypothetical protein